MADLRESVVDNRGLIKKIELAIPGFRGYRIREDLRASDNILRCYIADQIENEIKIPLDRIGETLTRAFEIDSIRDVKDCINQIKGLEAKIRHAEQGYSGISPQIRTEEKELNCIYEFDLALIKRVKDMQSLVQSMDTYILENKLGELKPQLNEIKKQASGLDNVFNQRLSLISTIEP
ncbi:hypothetical protein [Methanoregula sp. UBA64]|jgi:hypothetical protein|uniref:hypothetical protein n=1 Tax=Methanoregula sp. UBA64 TaxID=1915554 RepID=UPI0025F50044|nr:hypothetical protein [Methanoregula sp. UBA64]